MPLIPHHRLGDPVLLFALSCALALGWLLVALVIADSPAQIFAEAGPIEQTSALFLMMAAVALAGDMIRRGAWGRWHLAVLVLAAGLRELDWDKAFTNSGILSLRLYSGAAPIGQKIAGALVLTVLIWAGLRLLRRNVRPWLAGLRRGQAWAWLMSLALALYGVAKTLDGLGRKLESWGIDLSVWTNRIAGRGEEAMELFGAILVLQVVGLWVMRGRRS